MTKPNTKREESAMHASFLRFAESLKKEKLPEKLRAAMETVGAESFEQLVNVAGKGMELVERCAHDKGLTWDDLEPEWKKVVLVQALLFDIDPAAPLDDPTDIDHVSLRQATIDTEALVEAAEKLDISTLTTDELRWGVKGLHAASRLADVGNQCAESDPERFRRELSIDDIQTLLRCMDDASRTLRALGIWNIERAADNTKRTMKAVVRQMLHSRLQSKEVKNAPPHD